MARLAVRLFGSCYMTEIAYTLMITSIRKGITNDVIYGGASVLRRQAPTTPFFSKLLLYALSGAVLPKLLLPIPRSSFVRLSDMEGERLTF